MIAVSIEMDNTLLHPLVGKGPTGSSRMVGSCQIASWVG